MLRRLYPKIWPFVFIVCGIIEIIHGQHLHFQVFGQHVGFHTLMWFMMAFAHLNVFGNREH